MRKLMILALMGFFGSAVMTMDARADAPDEDMDDDDDDMMDDEDEEKEEKVDLANFDVLMVATGSPALDSIFKRSEGPIEIVASLTNEVQAAKAKFVESMGLTQGTPFDDAINDLATKAEGKIDVSFDEGKWPKLKAQEGCPENVKGSMNTLNSSMEEFSGAKGKLKTAVKEMAGIIEEAGDLTAEPKKLGLKATKVPKAIVKSKKNIKNLKAGVVVTKALYKEVKGMLKETKEAFGKQEEEEGTEATEKSE